MWDLGGWVRGLAWWGSLNQSTFFGCFLLHFFNQIRLTRMKVKCVLPHFFERHMQREDRLVAWPLLANICTPVFSPLFLLAHYLFFWTYSRAEGRSSPSGKMKMTKITASSVKGAFDEKQKKKSVKEKFKKIFFTRLRKQITLWPRLSLFFFNKK